MTPDEQFLDQLDYPMHIVTAAARGEMAGCLVGFVTQCSINPARFLVCISKNNRTFRVARDSAVLALQLVPEEAVDLAELFGGRTGDDVDKFSLCRWTEGRGGVPILDRCRHWVVAGVVDLIDGGDHMIFQVAPLQYGAGPRERVLMFKQVKHIVAGHPA
jgi:flavin reductase (DIM6/NTAB) family NADH-FMN oxidoreductase RutF